MTILRMTLPENRNPIVTLFDRESGDQVGEASYAAVATAHNPQEYEIDIGNVVGNLRVVSTDPAASGFAEIPVAGDSSQIIFATEEPGLLTTLTSILSLLTSSNGQISIAPPVSESGRQITLVRGDTYNNVRKPKLIFPVTKDYAGCQIHLTIRHRLTDAILMNVTNGVRESATLVSFPSIAPPETNFPDLPLDEYGLHIFDLQAVDVSLAKETIVVGGDAFLLLDQSR